MAEKLGIPEEILAPTRKASEWSSPRGLDKDGVPWRLWEKAKKLHWDPADIDYSSERSDWGLLNEDQQISVAALAQGFMIGEESVTLDILPLMMAMSDEGRLEEVMFLTTFAYEEAKHVDFFRRWFDAIGADLEGLAEKGRQRQIEAGETPPDPHTTEGMFESILPEAMRAVIVDRSPWAQLNASITYNQFVEGCLAISGYAVWSQMFEAFGVLPAMQEGLRLIRRDEGRHITYGTFLCQRLLAANPDLIEPSVARMHELNEAYFTTSVTTPEEPNPDDPLDQFNGLVQGQLVKRIAVLERAAAMSEEEVIADGEHSAENVERDLIGAD